MVVVTGGVFIAPSLLGRLKMSYIEKKKMDTIFRPVTNALTAIKKLFVIQLVRLPRCLLCVTEALCTGTRGKKKKKRLFAWISSSYFFPCGKARPDAESMPTGASPSCGHPVAHFYYKAIKVRPGQGTYLPIIIYSANRKEC